MNKSPCAIYLIYNFIKMRLKLNRQFVLISFSVLPALIHCKIWDAREHPQGAGFGAGWPRVCGGCMTV